MPFFRLTKQAKDDLKSIARYTQEIWGVISGISILAYWTVVFTG